MIIYAISGKLKTGKTTLANLLPYKRIAFGDILKQEVSETLGIPLEDLYNENKAKYRKILQWYGTDYRRAQDPLYWVKKFDLLLPDEPIIVDDVRFIEEAEYCKSKGAKLIRLEPYEGYSYYSNHRSETALDNYNFDAIFYPGFGKLKELTEGLINGTTHHSL